MSFEHERLDFRHNPREDALSPRNLDKLRFIEFLISTLIKLHTALRKLFDP